MIYHNHQHAIKEPKVAKATPKSTKVIPELVPKSKRNITPEVTNRRFSEFKKAQDVQLDPNCSCFQFRSNNVNLVEIIEEHMRKFNEFDQPEPKKFLQTMKLTIDAQKQTYQKFCYIPKFVDFYLMQQKKELNLKKFSSLLKSFFEVKDICLHDF